MRRNLFKPIVAGVLLGATLFWLPFFLVKVALIVVIAGTLIKFIVRSRFAYAHAHAGGSCGPEGKGRHSHWKGRKHGFRGGFGPWFHPAFAEKIRNMSDEDFNRFKEKFQSRWGSHCGDWDETTPPESQNTQPESEGTDPKATDQNPGKTDETQA